MPISSLSTKLKVAVPAAVFRLASTVALTGCAVNSGSLVMVTVIVTALVSMLPCALLRRTRNIAPLSTTSSGGVCSGQGFEQVAGGVLPASAQLPPTKRCSVNVTGPVPA